MELLLESILIMLIQITFLWLRTMNVRAVSSNRKFKAVLTGTGVQICWLVSIYMGVKSLMEAQYIVPVFYLLGGAIGTYLGMTRFRK